ncbi:AtpZ/AtpI family protein [Telluribacter sp. SYSU D00476]|uniref:AtpZ/AtpI family protein n=1 Tax=Telluribacter sp. SYSU D00476 TaxID=2811430 RepID=UPI001FF1705C|nr:AtpZ/AtpI family protein [Telluribacter sp. SYSU D00476]
MSDPKQDNLDKTRHRTNSYVRYSGLAFQMLGTILVFTYAGYKLDEWQQNKVPVWTLILSLLSIGGSLYMFIRGLPKN